MNNKESDNFDTVLIGGVLSLMAVLVGGGIVVFAVAALFIVVLFVGGVF